MWLQSSLPLKVNQAYKDQIVIFPLNQNTELVQECSLPYYDLLLSPALNNRIKKSKAHESFKWVYNSKLWSECYFKCLSFSCVFCCCI